MPTHIHDCVQGWWRVSEIGLQAAGDLTSYEQLQIQARVGTSKLLYASLDQLLGKFLQPLSSDQAPIVNPAKSPTSSS